MLTLELPEVIYLQLLPSILLFYIIQHTGDENTQTYRIEVFILIQNQILVSNLQRNVKQLEERINNLIM